MRTSWKLKAVYAQTMETVSVYTHLSKKTLSVHTIRIFTKFEENRHYFDGLKIPIFNGPFPHRLYSCLLSQLCR